MAAKRWRVGVAGLGHWYSGFGLARAMPEYARAELVAVAWPNEAQRTQFASMFGLESHASYEELLARKDIDIVHIAPPVVDIPALTIAAARACKHIILGKPMAMSLAQADEMVAAVARAGVVCVPWQALFRVGQAGLKRRLEAGEIGEVKVVHATGRWSIAEDWPASGRPGWFADPACVPGGSFIDEGIGDCDRVRWLVGSEVVRVEGKVANYVHLDVAPLEDWGFATFTFANGAHATLEYSWTINAPKKTGPSPKQNAFRQLEIVGTRGEIVTSTLQEPSTAVLRGGAAGWDFERRLPEPYGPQPPGALDHLIDCVESGKAPTARIEDAREALRLALAFYRAARTGQPVDPRV
ncbi:MAG: Gfo/Idh/MocA family oxidoreductase [Chloroflexi bacterium]|nr:Gfo/Idh/MocA family oxidoreductase [Chloroflexota bacterium]